MSLKLLSLPSALGLSIGAFALASSAHAQGAPCPPLTSLAFSDALSDAGSALQAIYDAPSDGNYTVDDLYAHYSAQLIVAGASIIAGADQIALMVPANSPYFGAARQALTNCGTHLSSAGAAIDSRKFDIAHSEILAFADEFARVRLADDGLVHLHLDPVLNAAGALAEDLDSLGAGHAHLVGAIQWAISTASSDVAAIQSACSFLSTVNDSTVLAMLGIDSVEDQSSLVAFGQGVTTEDFQLWLSENDGNGDKLLTTYATCAMTNEMYALGDALEGVGDDLETCPPCGTEDCPNLCTSDKECGECKATDVGMGADLGGGEFNPDDVKKLARLGAAVLAGTVVAEYEMPKPLIAPYEATHNAEGFADLMKVIRLACEMYPLMFVKFEYHCCEIDTCWDFWGCLPIWESVERLECVEHESDWQKLEGDSMYWHIKLHSSAKTLQRALKKAIDKKTKEFCKSACSGGGK